jgi:hypothetical protein
MPPTYQSNRISDVDVAVARGIRTIDALGMLGINHLKREGVELVGPDPRTGQGRDRFQVNSRTEKWICRTENRGGNDAISLVMFVLGCDFIQAVSFLTRQSKVQPIREQEPAWRPSNDNRPSTDNSNKAAWLASGRLPITPGTPPYLYLCKRLRVDELHYIPSTLGYVPARGDYADAMIATFGLAREIEPGVIAAPDIITGVHLTRLTPDGYKAPGSNGKAKIMVGPSKGEPIVIAPPNDLLTLAITEGIEDALTVHQALGIGAWAAGAAGRMPALASVIPDYIECVTIYAHADEHGQRGARELACALVLRGIEVFLEGLQ